MGKSSGGQEVKLLDRLRVYRPRTREQLAAYVEAFLGLKIPSQRICLGHDSPLDYLTWSFLGSLSEADSAGRHPLRTDTYEQLDDKNEVNGNHDCVVWANRGGGKTQLGAIASLLEGIFLPRCQIRILGGSEEQSQRMYGYLRQAFDRGFSQYIDGRVGNKGCQFIGRAGVQVLTQSDRSIRGHHVQRLRCDEVELFDRDIWQGAQFVTQSGNGISARLEAFSTMHRPMGLMHEIITSAPDNSMKVFHWCLWEVIERCEDRSCSRCCLWEDCRGKAKRAGGYYSIDDAISQKRRSSRAAWESEMLCRQPNREDAVFPEFDTSCHVRQLSYNSNLPLYRSIDFGFSNPLACLLIQVDSEDRVLVLDEHLKSRTTLAEQARLIKERWPWPVEVSYCDPAGQQRNEITGTAVVQEMAALGIPLRWRGSRILDGIELIRSFLSPACGPGRLYVSPKCENLIRAFHALQYSRAANGTLSELPEKDGVHDHVIDALRYFFVNRFGRKHSLREKSY